MSFSKESFELDGVKIRLPENGETLKRAGQQLLVVVVDIEKLRIATPKEYSRWEGAFVAKVDIQGNLTFRDDLEFQNLTNEGVTGIIDPTTKPYGGVDVDMVGVPVRARLAKWCIVIECVLGDWTVFTRKYTKTGCEDDLHLAWRYASGIKGKSPRTIKIVPYPPTLEKIRKTADCIVKKEKNK